MRLSFARFCAIVAGMLVIFWILGAADRILESLEDPAHSSVTKAATGTQIQEGIWRANNANSRLAALEIIAGSLALGFLGWTLFETRRAASASVRSADAAEAANQPYVLLNFDPKIDSSTNLTQVNAKFENYGKGPAIALMYEVAFIGLPTQDARYISDKPLVNVDEVISQADFGEVIQHGLKETPLDYDRWFVDQASGVTLPPGKDVELEGLDGSSGIITRSFTLHSPVIVAVWRYQDFKGLSWKFRAVFDVTASFSKTYHEALNMAVADEERRPPEPDGKSVRVELRPSSWRIWDEYRGSWVKPK